MARTSRGIIGRTGTKRSPLAARDVVRRAFTSALGRFHGGYAVVAEYPFMPTRRFRFDLAAPAFKVAVEFQGHYRGGHHGSAGLHSDCEKFSLAASYGWVILPISYRLIYDARMLPVMVQALEDALATQWARGVPQEAPCPAVAVVVAGFRAPRVEDGLRRWKDHMTVPEFREYLDRTITELQQMAKEGK